MNIISVLERKWVIPAAVGVVGTACGFAGGYFLGRRNGFERASVLMDNVIDEARESVRILDEASEEIIEVAGNAAADILSLVKEPADGEAQPAVLPEEEREEARLREEQAIDEANAQFPYDDEEADAELVHIRPDPTEDIQPERRNVFVPVMEEWNEEFEQANRDLDGPYVIHKDVFLENETEYQQETLTYYEGDDIMADQQDTPIYGYAGLTGDLKWGHGSEDPRVVYIRNDQIRREWEILRHSGRFEFEVEGHSLEEGYEVGDLKHSKVLKFRDD